MMRADRGGAAKYARIAADLRSLITAGELGIGDRVPSEPELTGRYRVSKTTAARALEVLAAEGVIERRSVNEGPGQETGAHARVHGLSTADLAPTLIIPCGHDRGLDTRRLTVMTVQSTAPAAHIDPSKASGVPCLVVDNHEVLATLGPGRGHS